jgi:lipopolysaccharide/colanic/teichoic acid biosynthesis glycosyltransferase
LWLFRVPGNAYPIFSFGNHILFEGEKHMNTKQRRIDIQEGIKRLLDILISVFGLLLLFPILIIIAVAIKIDSPGAIIYSHRRIGKDRGPFNLYKFRSMVCGGDDTDYLGYLNMLIDSEQKDNGNGLPYQKLDCDPRITRLGGILRKYYLDELPQLWNVIRGDMSLVGPRPHVQIEVDHYTPLQRRRLCVKPGLTGLWQVAGKADCTFSELIGLDLYYIDHWSLWLDIQILFSTGVLMLRGGEGFWVRKAKEIPEKLPVGQLWLASKAAPYMTLEQEERIYMSVFDNPKIEDTAVLPNSSRR